MLWPTENTYSPPAWRRQILCYNPKEAEQQQTHREEIVSMLEKELASGYKGLLVAERCFPLTQGYLDQDNADIPLGRGRKFASGTASSALQNVSLANLGPEFGLI